MSLLSLSLCFFLVFMLLVVWSMLTLWRRWFASRHFDASGRSFRHFPPQKKKKMTEVPNNFEKKKINERTTTRNNTGKRQRYQMILKTLNGHFQSELSIEQFIEEAKKMAKNLKKKNV